MNEIGKIENMKCIEMKFEIGKRIKGKRDEKRKRKNLRIESKKGGMKEKELILRKIGNGLLGLLKI